MNCILCIGAYGRGHSTFTIIIFILSFCINLFANRKFAQYYQRMEPHTRDPSKGHKATGTDLPILFLEPQRVPPSLAQMRESDFAY